MCLAVGIAIFVNLACAPIAMSQHIHNYFYLSNHSKMDIIYLSTFFEGCLILQTLEIQMGG